MTPTSHTNSSTPAALHSRGGFLSWAARERGMAVGVVLVVLVVAMCVANPAFATLDNCRDLLVQAAPVVIVGCGMTFVVISGEVDISVGSQFGLLAACMGCMASPSHVGLSTGTAIALTLLAGVMLGTVNGVLVTVGKVPSIVATLGMLTVLRGATELLLGGNWITDLPDSLRRIGTGALWGIPYCVLAASVVAGGLSVVAQRTRLGLWVRAIGGNSEATAIARVSVLRVKVLTFMLVGFLTALAAVLCVPQQSVVESGIGIGFDLVVVTAVVVGGTSIRGGVGGIAGTVLAALLLSSIRTSLIFLKLGESAVFWERAIQGGFILAAVLADHYASRSRHRATQRVGAVA